MTLALAGSLVVLALLDSTSFGTLLIPIWFLLAPGRVPVARVLLFLGTVAAFYLVVGVGLLFGLDAILVNAEGWFENPMVVRWQLVLGVGLFVLSFFIDRKKGGEDGEQGGEKRSAGRLTRWRSRALGTEGEKGGLVGLISLALAAALLEVATMLPYLGAIGLLATSDLGLPARVGTLAGYCVVMILPALILLTARLLARRRVEPFLQRVAAWMERSGAEMTAWIVGIVGFFLAGDAVNRMPEALDFLQSLGG